MKLRFARRAVEDLKAVSAYLRERDPTGARRVRADVLCSLSALRGYTARPNERK
jgi:hypothetical protein